MSFVHHESPECMNNALELFTVPATQTGEEHGRWHDAHPVSTITDSGPIEFSIDGSSEYLDLAHSYLFVKAKLTAGDGGVVTDKKVAPVSLFLQSLFSQVDVTLNGKLISSGSNNYPYRFMLGTLLNYGDEAKTSKLTSQLFYKNSAGAMDEVDPTKTVAAGGNCRLISRYKHSNKSVSIEMTGPIHADIFFQHRYILDFVNLKLKFSRSKSEFCLMSGEANPNYKVVIEDAIVFVRKVKLNPSVALAIADKLKTTTAKYPICRTDLKTFSVPAVSLGISQDVFTGQLPDRVIISVVDNDAYNGSYTKSPYNYKNYDLNFLGVYADGIQVPQKPLQLKYSAAGGQGFILGYQSLFNGTGTMIGDHGNQISRDNYANGYTLHCFNLTPYLSNGENFNLIKQGNLRVEAQLATPLAQTVNFMVYGEFDSLIEIDHSRNILFDYAN